MTRRVASLVRPLVLFASLLAWTAPLFAAAPPAPPSPSVERSVAVASYGSGAVKSAPLRGTDLAPGAAGSVKAAAKLGSTRLSLSVRGLPAPTSFGPAFLTYVAWEVTAEGRTRSLGEIVVTKGAGKLATTSQATSFGLFVTAEPYFAVGSPSELVVLANAPPGAAGEARFETFAGSVYSGGDVSSPSRTAKPPFDVDQARNAVRIARVFGAESFSADSFARAATALADAQSMATDKRKAKSAGPRAREAVQSAEAARALAVRRIEEARVASEKADAAARAAEAREDAARAKAETARAQAEAARAHASAEAAQSDAARAQATAADEARRRADAERTAAAADLARRQAEAEKQTLRSRLLRQFNLILETRDSARGLIVNLGDVLFDLNKFTLRPEAREKLAKLSGIVLGNPGLVLTIEGHTDATGSDEYNQKLSEDRAGAVRDYLVEQKIAPESITSRGFGKTKPVSPNDTPDGRQKNRRVEIVVSGDVIGTEIEEQKSGTPPPR